MKVAMMGSGGVGGTFGARLAQAGHEVVFLARGAHAAALRQHGLRLESERGNLHLAPVVVHEDPAAVGPVDLVVVAVKLRDGKSAASAIAPLVVPATTVVSLQNGVEKDELLVAALGREPVVGGVSYLAAVLAEPGRIVQTGKLQRVLVGELAGGSSERCAAIVAAFAGAGIDAQPSDDIRRATWEKFVFLTAVAGLGALTRQPIGPIREHPVTRALLLDALREVVALGRAEGVAIDADYAERQLAFVDTLAPPTLASMAQDLLRGRPLELEWLNGAVVRRAAARGVPTPVHRAIHAGLILYADGAPAARG